MSGQHCENCDVKRETVNCYPRNVDRCWSSFVNNVIIFPPVWPICFATSFPGSFPRLPLVSAGVLSKKFVHACFNWGKFIAPLKLFSQGKDPGSEVDLLCYITDHLINDWSLREQWVLFPENLNVSRDEVEGNIEIRGKQNSLFPKGPVIKCLLCLGPGLVKTGLSGELPYACRSFYVNSPTCQCICPFLVRFVCVLPFISNLTDPSAPNRCDVVYLVWESQTGREKKTSRETGWHVSYCLEDVSHLPGSKWSWLPKTRRRNYCI